MNCNLSKCRNLIITTYNCNKCDNLFCSNTCLINHVFQSHQSKNIDSGKKTYSLKKLSTIKSPFIEQGEFLSEFVNNPYYDYTNFEYIIDTKTNKKKLIGAGTLGEVFLAKNINKSKIIENSSLDFVYRELNIHRKLNHKNIIRLYNFIETDKYANNGSLFNTIRTHKQLDEKTAFNYFIQTVNALLFLHENNLVHRDLKPENLLLTEDNTIKLGDFTWCVEMSFGSRTTFCGTYEYMAPEIVKDKPYNQCIDVWSLGILLYELLHGYSPFRAKDNNNKELIKDDESYVEILKNIIKFKFEIERTDLSEDCVNLITKLLCPIEKNRIKIKEIFNHPWVLGFEKEYRRFKAEGESESKGEESVIEDSSKGEIVINTNIEQNQKERCSANNNNLNEINDEISDINDDKENNFIKMQTQNITSNKLTIRGNEEKKEKENLVETKEIHYKLSKYQSKKENPLYVNINSLEINGNKTSRDYKDNSNAKYLKNSDNEMSLFDKVLNKVQEKNKTSKKIIVNENVNNENINDKTNKKTPGTSKELITSLLEFDNENKKYDNEIKQDITTKIKVNRNLYDKDIEPQFNDINKSNENIKPTSLLKDIQEIDKGIEDLDATYKNYDFVINNIIENHNQIDNNDESQDKDTNISNLSLGVKYNSMEVNEFNNNINNMNSNNTLGNLNKKIPGSNLEIKKLNLVDINSRTNADTNNKSSNRSDNKNARLSFQTIDCKVYESDEEDDEGFNIWKKDHDKHYETSNNLTTRKHRKINTNYDCIQNKYRELHLNTLEENRNSINKPKKNDYMASQETIFTFKPKTSRDKKKLNLEESIKKSKFTNETNRESRILKDTKQIYETIYILEKAKKITEEEEEKQLSGFDKFINMLNPFKCTK